MVPAGGDDDAEESGRPPKRHEVDRSADSAIAGQNLGAGSESRKRKAAVTSKGLVSLAEHGERLEVAWEDSWRIKKEIEDLKSQLDDDMKKLGHCEENEKLRVQLAVMMKEMQCLRKQNEDMQANKDSMVKWNEELQAKIEGLVKLNQELQTNNDDLMKQNNELQTNSDEMKKWNKDLQAKNNGLTKWKEELQTKHDVMLKQNQELQAKNVGLVKQNDKLQTKNGSMIKWNEELQTKHDVMSKQNEELQAKNAVLVKQNDELQTNNGSMMKWNSELHVKNGGLTNRNEELQANNDGLKKRNKELQANNDSLMKRNEELQAKNAGLHKNVMEILEIQIDTKRKHLLQFLELYTTVNFPIQQLKMYDEDSSSELMFASMTEKHGINSKTEDKSKHPELEVATTDGKVQDKMEKLNELLEHENVSERLGPVAVLKSIQMNKELHDTQRELIVGELDGCTDIGAKISWDIILESVQRLKQAEPTLRQAASSFKEIGRLQAEVARLDNAVNQMVAKNHTLVETNAALKEEHDALKEEVESYATELEHTRKINEELESEMASAAEQLMAMIQQDLPPILNEFDLKILVEVGTSLKSCTQNLKQIAAKLKELPGVIKQITLEQVESAAGCGSLVLAILKSQIPTLDLSVIKQGFKGTQIEAEDLADSLKHLVEPLSSTLRVR